jgi:hypothetical protein
MSSDAVDYERLMHLLTAERLGSYVRACDDVDAAFALYEWNIEVSAAAMSMTAMVEVLVRNALDEQMRKWADERGAVDWLATAPLDDRGRRDVVKARGRASRGRRAATHGHVVAELSLGFWRYLVSRRYLTSLWIPALQHAFPHRTDDANRRQRSVEQDLDQLLFLRNRAAHHEPLHRRDLTADLDRAKALAAGIDPTAHAWLTGRETLSDVLRHRPPTA